MRVGSLQMTNRYLMQLNRSYENQTKLMEQADGSKLHRPSDNAIGYSKYLRYSVSYSANNQFQTNVKTAVSWMKNSGAALDDIAGQQFKTIVEKTNAAQSTNTNVDMKSIANEMLVCVQQAVADGNTQVGGRYLFSGQADLVQPYVMSDTKYDRGMTKTLDDKQKSFFNDAQLSVDMAQMLVLDGSDGEIYYLNTQTGKVYSKEFMDEGYKDIIAQGRETVEDGDAVGTISNFAPQSNPADPDSPLPAINSVSDYFDSRGVITEAGRKAGTDPTDGFSITVGTKTVNLTFSTVSQYIVTYSGDSKQFSMVKENGEEQPASDRVNVSGVDIAGYSIFDAPDSGNEFSGANCFNDMLTVVAMCERGDSRWMSSDGITLANNSFDTVNNAHSKLGARQQAYEACQDMLTTQNETILGDITDVSSTNVAELSVEWMQALTVYNLSLSVGSRILPPTLADYL